MREAEPGPTGATGSNVPEEIIEGSNPVREALRAGRPINKVLLARDIGRHSAIGEILHLARQAGVPVEYVDRRALDRQSATGRHQGVMARAAARDYVGLADLLAVSGQKGEAALYVVLDGIEDPHNLGAIIRTAEGTGVQGVVVAARRAVGLTAAVARASAGAVEYVPVARVANISEALRRLKEVGVWVVGLDQAGEQDYTAVDFTLPAALVVGAEGRGLARLVRERCDFLVRIPMVGKVASLNASVAAAVVMYEALRQRTKLGATKVCPRAQ